MVMSSKIPSLTAIDELLLDLCCRRVASVTQEQAVLVHLSTYWQDRVPKCSRRQALFELPSARCGAFAIKATEVAKFLNFGGGWLPQRKAKVRDSLRRLCDCGLLERRNAESIRLPAPWFFPASDARSGGLDMDDGWVLFEYDESAPNPYEEPYFAERWHKQQRSGRWKPGWPEPDFDFNVAAFCKLRHQPVLDCPRKTMLWEKFAPDAFRPPSMARINRFPSPYLPLYWLIDRDVFAATELALEMADTGWESIFRYSIGPSPSSKWYTNADSWLANTHRHYMADAYIHFLYDPTSFGRYLNESTDDEWWRATDKGGGLATISLPDAYIIADQAPRLAVTFMAVASNEKVAKLLHDHCKERSLPYQYFGRVVYFDSTDYGSEPWRIMNKESWRKYLRAECL